jgi:tripartite-type tricarboxylate transporter receptor subunit TctC
MRKLKAVFLAVTICVSVIPIGLGAQRSTYPKGPVRLVITHGPGGATDTAARLIQPYLQKYLGVPVVIDNMEGAGGNIARSFVFKQPPDGQILLVSQQPSMSSGQLVSGGRFDVLKFAHVFNIAGKNYDCLAVPANSPFKTLDDVKRASGSKPVTLAGSGIGTNAYILAMLLKSRAGISVTYVPYNSGSEAAVAVAGGQTQIGTGSLDAYYPLHQQKKLRILAVSGPERDHSHPELPSLVELGYPEIKLDQMTGVFAPPGLAKDRLDVLVSAFQKAFADKEYLALAAKAGHTLQPLPPTEFLKASDSMFRTIKSLEAILKPAR